MHKASLNREQTASANLDSFSSPEVLEVFYKYICGAESTQRSEHSILHVYPITWHSAMKIVKKPFKEPKICLEAGRQKAA